MVKFLSPFSKSAKEKKRAASQASSSSLPASQSARPVAPDQQQPTNSNSTDKVTITNSLLSDDSLPNLSKQPRNLWQEAAKRLNEEQRKALGLQLDDSLSLTKTIDEVVQQVEKTYEEYQARGWKITRRDGSAMVDVLPMAKKILQFALKSKGIVDAAVKFDPNGYSSSVWTVISLGLQLAQNYQDRIHSVFEASELLANNLHRYANIEANYRNQEIPDVRHLEDKLCSVYEAILGYSAMVQLEIKTPFGGRAWYHFYSLSEQPLQQLQERIFTAEEGTNIWLPLIRHEYRLKESAQINQKVDEVAGKLDQIFTTFSMSVAALDGGVQQLEAIRINMVTKEDIDQLATFLKQLVAEALDQPDGNVKDSADSTRPDAQTFPSEDEIDALLRSVFVEYHEFDEDTKQHQRVIEQLPEMRAHRSRSQNLLQAEGIMEWMESGASQLLLVNGNWVLGRSDFNSLFVGPLLILGDSSFESVLVLRHFCGGSPSSKTNNFRTLVQALIVQMFKQHPASLGSKLAGLTKEGAGDMSELWKLFVTCLRETKVHCVFIIIDSINYLQDARASDGSSEKDMVLSNMHALVEDDSMLIKILLTTSLSLESPGSIEEQMAVMTTSNIPSRTSASPLSLSIMQDEMLLVPQKLIEIQERRCLSLRYSQLPLIYPLDSIIYTLQDGQLQAFVVSSVYGMEPQSRDTYAPFRLRVWSIGHDGKRLTKRFHDFSIAQFLGERAVASLKYIPAGYLPNEAEQRKKLAARGRKYCSLAHNFHHKQIIRNGEPVRIVIDQESVPEELRASYDFDVYFEIKSHHNVRPRFAMVCPPTTNVYHLEDASWIPVLIDDIHSIQFKTKKLETLIMSDDKKNLARNIVQSHVNQMKSNEGPEEDKRPPEQVGNGGRRKGLTLVLHGDSGTGKTFAAACIAEAVERPILSDTTAIRDGSSVDFKLSKMFQLAQRWRAILVIEDAETFLPQRSGTKTDPSTLTLTIRAMDLYTGVLVLTSQKPKQIDEFVWLQATFTLGFPPLKKEEKLEVWDHLVRDGDSDAYDIMKHLREINRRETVLGTLFINNSGHEISNVVSAARKLAEFEKSILLWRHIETIIENRRKWQFLKQG